MIALLLISLTFPSSAYYFKFFRKTSPYVSEESPTVSLVSRNSHHYHFRQYIWGGSLIGLLLVVWRRCQIKHWFCKLCGWLHRLLLASWASWSSLFSNLTFFPLTSILPLTADPLQCDLFCQISYLQVQPHCHYDGVSRLHKHILLLMRSVFTYIRRVGVLRFLIRQPYNESSLQQLILQRLQQDHQFSQSSWCLSYFEP